MENNVGEVGWKTEGDLLFMVADEIMGMAIEEKMVRNWKCISFVVWHFL